MDNKNPHGSFTAMSAHCARQISCLRLVSSQRSFRKQLQFRPLLVPVGALLVGMSDLEDARFVERFA